MASQSQAKKDAAVAEFRSITTASQNDALKYLKKYNWRVDVAVDAFFSDPPPPTPMPSGQPSVQKMQQLFERWQDPGQESIGVDGVMAMAAEIGLDLEAPEAMAFAYEVKSPAVGEMPKKNFIDGLKALKCDSVDSLKAAVPKLRQRLASDPEYFSRVYLYAFGYGLEPGQRTLPLEMAQAFWQVLIPFGLSGGALAHVDDLSAATPTSTFPGWKPEYTDMWLEFLAEKKVRGISKDTWNMFIDFVRTADDKFQRHDSDGSWPSLIDDFVEYAREKLGTA